MNLSLLKQIRPNFNRLFLASVVFWFFISAFALLIIFNSGTLSLNTTNDYLLATSTSGRKLADIEQRVHETNQLIDDFADILSQVNLSNLTKSKLLNLQLRLKNLKKPHPKNEKNKTIEMQIPSIEYEQNRRNIRQNIREFGNFVNSLLDKLEKGKNVDAKSARILVNEQKDNLLNKMQMLADSDQNEEWRRNEIDSLSNLVQARLQFLQNPKDCASAKKLVCNLNKACGYGCQIHHVVYCFIFAYATQRTMLLQSTAWRYHKNGWNAVFQPISQNCTTKSSDQKSVNWPGNPDAQVINLPIIDSLQSKPPFLPLTVPEDLNVRLRKVHGNPIVWWIGQLMKYLLKPVPELDQYLNDLLIQIGFQKPIVGVHIRRTDKIGSEASFHNIEEYMEKVDEYYNRLEMAQFISKRRVFIATDDPKVLTEAKNKYGGYEILGNTDIAKSAAIFSRYSNSSLHGIIFDIHALSLTNYLVCTFSSQVCRMAYELMQNYHIDASENFQSLDDIYYYGGQNAHNVVAVLPHKAANEDEIDLEIGDLIGIEGNHWNGYSKGLNRRSNKQGLFPSFKVLDRIETFAFPTYPQVSNLT